MDEQYFQKTASQNLFQTSRQVMPKNKEYIMIIFIKKLLAISYFLCFMGWSYLNPSVQNDDVFVVFKNMFGIANHGFSNQVFNSNFSGDEKEEPVYSKVSALNPESAWIKSIRIESKTFDSEYAHDGYSDFSNITFYGSLSKGFWFAGKAGNGTKIDDRWTVWIDFNKNGKFEDSEIQLEATQTEFSRKIRLPKTVEKDFTTRMRIFYGSKTDGKSAGEFEDYTLKIIN